MITRLFLIGAFVFQSFVAGSAAVCESPLLSAHQTASPYCNCCGDGATAGEKSCPLQSKSSVKCGCPTLPAKDAAVLESGSSAQGKSLVYLAPVVYVASFLPEIVTRPPFFTKLNPPPPQSASFQSLFCIWLV